MVREPCTGQWTHQLLLDDLQGGLTSYCTRYLDISSVQLPIVTFSHQSVNLRCDLFTTSNMLVILCQASVGGCCPLYSSSPRPRPAAAPRRYWPAVSRPFGGYNQPARGHGATRRHSSMAIQQYMATSTISTSLVTEERSLS